MNLSDVHTIYVFGQYFASVLRHQKLHLFLLDLAYGRISRLSIKKNFTINMENTILRLDIALIRYFLLRSENMSYFLFLHEITSFFVTDGLSSSFSFAYSKELWCLYRILQYNIFKLIFIIVYSSLS